jgi:dTDP-4-amino-4,6-dideoxygalactose transaminase
MNRLRERGIGTQVHYLPVHLQPYYAKRYGDHSLPGAVAYYERCLSLPLFARMEETDVDRVADALAAALENP